MPGLDRELHHKFENDKIPYKIMNTREEFTIIKVGDNGPSTIKYRGAVHVVCNLKKRPTSTIFLPMVKLIMSRYDFLSLTEKN